MTVTYYSKPNWAMKHVLNPAIELVTKSGLSLRGSRVLAVQGRKSGKWYTTPVNLLEFEGGRYLVAPRGETGWVKNIRSSKTGIVRLGRKSEPIAVEEVADDQKLPVLREYLRRWSAETAGMFGLSKKPSDEQIAAIVSRHPVFRIVG
ncbi:MAG: nitroreductase/quinone reductase family protein [Dehalococcoidia bacterium]|nr:nitroreductase/quinone reductase family protein [Dehalococcoidia bacterium]